MKKCSNCQMIVDDRVTYCPRCGYSFNQKVTNPFLYAIFIIGLVLLISTVLYSLLASAIEQAIDNYYYNSETFYQALVDEIDNQPVETGSAYNDIVDIQKEATNALANVLSAYQRRADLIPNLVETMKDYATYEENSFDEVMEARTKVSQITIDPNNCTPEQLQSYQKAQGELGQTLGRLIAISESYPELKANETFIDLQVQLEGTENRINEARNKYNAAVTEYNQVVQKSSKNSSTFGFRTMEKLAAEEGAEKAPSVKF